MREEAGERIATQLYGGVLSRQFWLRVSGVASFCQPHRCAVAVPADSPAGPCVHRGTPGVVFGVGTATQKSAAQKGDTITLAHAPVASPACKTDWSRQMGQANLQLSLHGG